ncbi:MAG: GNAT family N-acetyltransferase [Pirellulaceae bacterium]|nr:GNAT family N-acetyltransferase [Pirellulaceae bacterium]
MTFPSESLPFSGNSYGSITIRPVQKSDLNQILALNQASVPAVGSCQIEEIEYYFQQSHYFPVLVSQRDQKVIGFLIALPHGLGYQSINYRWFSERYDNFFYVDRVAIQAEYRGGGIGKAIYRHLFDFAEKKSETRVTLEVNSRPMNKVSQQFHRLLGFVPVGSQDTENGTKTVTLMVKELPAFSSL